MHGQHKIGFVCSSLWPWNYGLVVWGGIVAKETLNKLQKIQNTCFKFIGKNQKLKDVAKNGNIHSKNSLIKLEHAKLGYKLLHNTIPSTIERILSTDSKNKTLQKTNRYNTIIIKLNLPQIKNKCYRDSFLYQANKKIMLLPQKTTLLSYPLFIQTLKKILMDAMTQITVIYEMILWMQQTMMVIQTLQITTPQTY